MLPKSSSSPTPGIGSCGRSLAYSLLSTASSFLSGTNFLVATALTLLILARTSAHMQSSAQAPKCCAFALRPFSVIPYIPM
eukprot:3266709-Amphidinium_carterae.2